MSPLAIGLVLALAPTGQQPFVERLSLDPTGQEATGSSGVVDLSADGRFVVFQSDASLVPGDVDGTTDVYLRDRLTGALELVSVTDAGAQTATPCLAPSVSDDGQRVAFYSTATELTPDLDTNGTFDVFVRDRGAGTTTLVSVAAAGGAGDSYSFFPDLSGDGRYVAFESVAGDLAPGDAPGWKDIFRRDLQLGVTELVSAGASGAVPNGASQQPSISADGSRVAFESTATNLGPPDTGPTRDVYVRDLVTGVTTMASLKSTGGQSILGSSRPALSADGTMVAFEGSGLVPLDLNGATDVHVRDLVAGTTTRVSTDGVGREGNGYSTDPAISADGRFVAFSSVADNLLLEDHAPWPYRQVYVKDRSYGTTYLVSPTPTGAYGNQASNLPAISADDGQVAFDSYASNLVPGDGNDSQDVFLGELPVAGPRLRLVQHGSSSSGAPVRVELGNASPTSVFVVAVALDDQGPLPTPWGLAYVPSADLLLPLATDASGEASLSMPLPGLVGRVLCVHGLDLATSTLSTADSLLVE